MMTQRKIHFRNGAIKTMIIMHLILECDVSLDSVKNVRQYILWYTVQTSLTLLITSHFGIWYVALCCLQRSNLSLIWEKMQ